MEENNENNKGIEIEEGEISDNESEEVYVPLKRPSLNKSIINKETTNAVNISPEENQSGDSFCDSSSEGDSDGMVANICSDGKLNRVNKKRTHKVKRTVMVRVNLADQQEKKAKFRKYNVWTAALQEDALTEDMRGCDVTQSKANDRNVENYDIFLKQRMRGDTGFKRRHSFNSDDEVQHLVLKKSKGSNELNSYGEKSKIFCNKFIGSKNRCYEPMYEPRFIQDLGDFENKDPRVLAKEMAENLQETKDELLVRIVEVLGLEIPIEIYKETQRIEADGGMEIKNGKRRRTPGGVFLFLLKKHEKLTHEEQKAIFSTDNKNNHKKRRECETKSRNKKVEELKKCLSEQENEFAVFTKREHFQDSNSKPDWHSENLSNPPPSPVGTDHCSGPTQANKNLARSLETHNKASDSSGPSETNTAAFTGNLSYLGFPSTDMEFS